MATAKHNKPKLVRIGDHLLDPSIVGGFKKAKKGLYIIQIKGEDERQYPLWVSENEMEESLQFFDVQGMRP